MSSRGELNGDGDHPSETQGADESCMIVEDEISTIQIDDTLNSTCQSNSTEVAHAEDGEPAVDTTISNSFSISVEDSEELSDDFQVIDQVGESDVSLSQETTDGANETTIVSHTQSICGM
jgi:hypothetical protein